MPLAASPEPAIDPARRYHALVQASLRARTAGESYDLLDAMVEAVLLRMPPLEHVETPEPPEDPNDAAAAEEHRVLCAAHAARVAQAELELRSNVEDGIRAAIQTYDVPTTRYLFDACLLAGASARDLEEEFAVSVFETAAYSVLFFDRTVFPNAFHLVHYIGSRVDPAEQDLLRMAQTQGLDAIAMQYGAARAVSPEAALASMLAADAAAYRRVRELPLTHQSTNQVRALGKSVRDNALGMQKVHDAKSAALERGKGMRKDEDFVITHAPPNPTLEELLAAGGAVAEAPDDER